MVKIITLLPNPVLSRYFLFILILCMGMPKVYDWRKYTLFSGAMNKSEDHDDTRKT